MITYKAIIIQGGRRKDGTYPVKIRVTFKGVSRRLPTTLVATDADLTRSGRIKNATILERAGELIARMRAAAEDLSPFTLEAWDVDRVVGYIRDRLAGEDFRLDFFAWGRAFIQGKGEGTRAGYVTALNAFGRFLGGGSIDINSISRSLLLDFQEWADKQGRVFYNYRKGEYQMTGRATTAGGNAGRWVSRLSHLFQAAKDRYNDEDAGRIVIPRSPFSNLPRPRVQHQGQRPLTQEEMQRVIDSVPSHPVQRIARAAMLASFLTMGANMADLWAARHPIEGEWKYNRQKTAQRREDGAEVRVYLPDELRSVLRVLTGQCEGDWWLPALHRWRSSRIADTQVNKYLREWCEAEGWEPFTFYAGRKTWATVARRLGVEKATIDEALGHVGEFRVADIYAERNWSLAAEAHRRVVAAFRWEEVSDNNRTKTEDIPGK